MLEEVGYLDDPSKEVLEEVGYIEMILQRKCRKRLVMILQGSVGSGWLLRSSFKGSEGRG